MNRQASVRTVLAGLVLSSMAAACAPESEGPPVTTGMTVYEEPTIVRIPAGSMSLRVDNGAVVLSAGFMRQIEVGQVAVPSYVSWAPDSRHFFINDSGSASWSTFRLWSANGGNPRESTALRQAAIDELARRNGCGAVPAADVTTHGMGWDPDGERVYVLAEVRRRTGDCAWAKVHNVLLVADPADGRVLETLSAAEGRSRYPTLGWSPVTEP